jgi:hypothetical protein
MSLPWTLSDSQGSVMTSSVMAFSKRPVLCISSLVKADQQKEHDNYLPNPSVTTQSFIYRYKLLFDAVCTEYTSHSTF